MTTELAPAAHGFEGPGPAHPGLDELASRLMAGDAVSVAPNGGVLVAGREPGDLVERYGSPLYVLSAETIRQSYRRIDRAFRSAWPRAVRVNYACKANNSVAVRAILTQEGAGGECFSLGELYASVLGGCQYGDIVINGANKSRQLLRAAVDLGVMLNIDSLDEVGWLEEPDGEASAPIRVCIRLKAAGGIQSGPGPRFRLGFSLQSAREVIERLGALAHVQLCGFSIHIGPPAADPAVCRTAGAQLAADISSLRDQTAFEPGIVNLGGGWVHERDPELSPGAALRPGIEDYALSICDALRAGLPASMALPELSIEPGRYLTGNAGVLLSRVETIREDEGRRWAFLDATPQNHTPAIGGAVASHRIASATGRSGIGRAEPASFASPVPLEDAGTVVSRGEVMVVLDVGAYAEGQQSHYKGAPGVASVLLDADRREAVIRPPADLEEPYRRELIPPWLSAELSPTQAAHVLAVAEPTPRRVHAGH